MNPLKFNGLAIGLGLLVISLQVNADIHPACSQGDSDVVPLHRQAPSYPHSAWLSCIEGHVVVDFLIDEKGRVLNPEVSESEPPALFDRAALGAIKQWRFQPRCMDGQPVARKATQRIEFDQDWTEDRPCPTDLDAPTADLLTEISTWYALLHGHMVDFPSLHGAEHLKPRHDERFSGDLAKVAAFHRQFIASLIDQSAPRWVPPRPHNLFMESGGFDDPPEPRQILERLATHRKQYQAQASLRGERYRQQQQEFRKLRVNTQLSTDELDILVLSFTGSLALEVDGLFPVEAETVQLLTELADFLELKLGDWAMDGWLGLPAFDDWDLQSAFVEHLMALDQHVEALQEAQRQWSGSYLDYM